MIRKNNRKNKIYEGERKRKYKGQTFTMKTMKKAWKKKKTRKTKIDKKKQNGFAKQSLV